MFKLKRNSEIPRYQYIEMFFIKSFKFIKKHSIKVLNIIKPKFKKSGEISPKLRYEKVESFFKNIYSCLKKGYTFIKEKVKSIKFKKITFKKITIKKFNLNKIKKPNFKLNRAKVKEAKIVKVKQKRTINSKIRFKRLNYRRLKELENTSIIKTQKENKIVVRVNKNKHPKNIKVKLAKDKVESLNLVKKEVVMQVEDSVKEFTWRWYHIFLYYLVIFALGIFVGCVPFIGLEPTKAISLDNRDCKYSEWKEEEVNYCLVNKDGEPYEGEYVKYSKDALEKMCIKYTRRKICD